MNHYSRNFLLRVYVEILTLIAFSCRYSIGKIHSLWSINGLQRIVAIVSRPQDVELLSGLSEYAIRREDIDLNFWVTKKFAERYPYALTQLEMQSKVELIFSYAGLWKTLIKLMSTDYLLTTAESTAAKYKLPGLITILANVSGVDTYTFQHGFETIGLTYCDHVHNTEVGFTAKTVLIWGPVEELPAWVSYETRSKCVSVGCPKKQVIIDDDPPAHVDERPIVAIFENLHWHRFSQEYVYTFLEHLQEISSKREELCFIFKAHPVSVRKRTAKMAQLLNFMKNVIILDKVETNFPLSATPWLLSRASGIITTPSTIALDGALFGVPVAVTRYGLDLGYYRPLSMLDSLENWEEFIHKLEEESSLLDLKERNRKFLERINIAGNPAARIIDCMSQSRL